MRFNPAEPSVCTRWYFFAVGTWNVPSISASIGFVALFGCSCLNGIVLIDHINELRKEKNGFEK
jgi:Cu/Ag efflux pump CusA